MSGIVRPGHPHRSGTIMFMGKLRRKLILQLCTPINYEFAPRSFSITSTLQEVEPRDLTVSENSASMRNP
jgi:hypothetical protein